ncbi:MAG: hypothetical protein GY796_34645 [Chloroflexi bacterium]|nr:hypothetical protein [Chloroflexota bacterium]
MLRKLELYEVRPGLSSQTTSTIEAMVLPSSLNLSFFDINAPVIKTTKRSAWDEIAKQVIQEHTELWETLAKL